MNVMIGSVIVFLFLAFIYTISAIAILDKIKDDVRGRR